MAKAQKKQPQQFSRTNPSPRYTELLDLYQSHHASGDKKNWSEGTVYPGKSLWPYLGYIKALVMRHNVSGLLDYGAGKGLQYTNLRVKEAGRSKIHSSVQNYWGVENVHCYDPGTERFNTFPEGTFEGVVSTDVLEHCPAEDLPWIIDEMFAKAEKFVFANIACYPAQTVLPNGENAHATIEPPEWWENLVESISKDHPDITYYFLATPDKTKWGTMITNDKVEIDAPKAGALPGNLLKAYWALIKQKARR